MPSFLLSYLSDSYLGINGNVYFEPDDSIYLFRLLLQNKLPSKRFFTSGPILVEAVT